MIEAAYRNGASGMIDADHGFIGPRRKPVLATAGEPARYRPYFATRWWRWRIVRFTPHRVVLESPRAGRMTVDPINVRREK